LDVGGRLIEKQFPNRDEIQLPMLSKLTGIYILKITTNQGSFFQKLIKNNRFSNNQKKPV